MGNINPKSEVDLHTKICTSAAQKLENTQVKQPSTCRPQAQGPVSCPKNTEPRTSLAKFDPFLRLPPELRIMIWSLAAPAPATIMQDQGRIWERAGGIPALLHTCRESRAEYLDTTTPNKDRAKRHPVYRLYDLPTIRKYGRLRMFISLAVDTIFFAHVEIPGCSGDSFLHARKSLYSLYFVKEIKNLALVTCYHWTTFENDEYKELKEISPSLRRFDMVDVDFSWDNVWEEQGQTMEKDGLMVRLRFEVEYREQEGLTFMEPKSRWDRPS